ncbi:MAG: DNA methyltransferase [Aigarchaeota archaeon]|nr:DNA methyltransferase [Candidatus Pelearchaeum maunauluense]
MASLGERLRQLGVVRSSTHSPPYMMHKFWARRPWLVFRRLITTFTREGDIILDPFAGGGVTLVEGLITRRRVVAADINPLAVFIMRHEAKPLDLSSFSSALAWLERELGNTMRDIYSASCPRCGARAEVEWGEYSSQDDRLLTLKLECPLCGYRGVKEPSENDLSQKTTPTSYRVVSIPLGEKTRDLLRRGYRYFHELFTQRNLAALLLLREAIERCPTDEETRSFLLFAFSSTLKWASKMSHRRGGIIEGWAMHAYWIYPRYLEINVWRQFLNRARAIARGKRYTNEHIGGYAVEAGSFGQLLKGEASFMVLNMDARNLPIPDHSVDAVITDPPYGGNVNYAELSDYFLWWEGELSPKNGEVIVNETRGLSLMDYSEGLREVFAECWRVLKDGAPLISTFNSKDMRIVAAFTSALRGAGFRYITVSQQPYLKVYETTFHAMQVDAMPFDFIFLYQKDVRGEFDDASPRDTDVIIEWLYGELAWCKRRKLTERDYRMRTYPRLIPAISCLDARDAIALAEDYERMIKEERGYFTSVRRRVVERRRKSST